MSQNNDYKTANYPADGDSTASGGYGSAERTWSTKAQRGSDNSSATGLIDQSVTGGLVGDQAQDAVQGRDASTREQFAHESSRDFGVESGLNPYGRNPDSRKEAEDLLASQYTESRATDYEGGASAGDA